MLQNWLCLPKAFAVIYIFESPNVNNYEAAQRASVVLVFEGSGGFDSEAERTWNCSDLKMFLLS